MATRASKKGRPWWQRLDLTGRQYVDPKHRTPAYERAVAALTALREENPDLLTPAFAEASTGYWEHVFAKRHGLKRTSGRNVPERLTGEPAYSVPFRRWMDHPSLWLKDGRPHSFVGQPYGLAFEDLQDLLRYCQTHGLTASIDAGLSWWYPGRTVLVEVKAQDE